jgi:hypothetical protein
MPRGVLMLALPAGESGRCRDPGRLCGRHPDRATTRLAFCRARLSA